MECKQVLFLCNLKKKNGIQDSTCGRSSRIRSSRSLAMSSGDWGGRASVVLRGSELLIDRSHGFFRPGISTRLSPGPRLG